MKVSNYSNRALKRLIADVEDDIQYFRPQIDAMPNGIRKNQKNTTITCLESILKVAKKEAENRGLFDNNEKTNNNETSI